MLSIKITFKTFFLYLLHIEWRRVLAWHGNLAMSNLLNFIFSADIPEFAGGAESGHEGPKTSEFL